LHALKLVQFFTYCDTPFRAGETRRVAVKRVASLYRSEVDPGVVELMLEDQEDDLTQLTEEMNLLMTVSHV
jgi:hypothetical protein